MRILILDSVLDSLDVEQRTASALGASATGWSGDPAELANADIVLHVRTEVSASLIGVLRRCRVIGRFGSGLDTIDLDAAREARISVVRVRDYCTPELASHTLALAFALERRLSEYLARGDAVEPQWAELARTLPIVGRHRATIIGLGSVGRAVASALLGVGYQVRVVTDHGADKTARLDIERVDLRSGLSEADFVFLHCALTEKSAQMISADTVALMGPGTLLINTARLGLLDETAVAAALSRESLAGLALDALLPAESPLREFEGDPRVLVTPHVGWYSERTVRRLREETVRLSVAAYSSARSKPEEVSS